MCEDSGLWKRTKEKFCCKCIMTNPPAWQRHQTDKSTLAIYIIFFLSLPLPRSYPRPPCKRLLSTPSPPPENLSFKNPFSGAYNSIFIYIRWISFFLYIYHIIYIYKYKIHKMYKTTKFFFFFYPFTYTKLDSTTGIACTIYSFATVVDILFGFSFYFYIYIHLFGFILFTLESKKPFTCVN